jgi:vacuolar-type H+-ATPase subunit H
MSGQNNITRLLDAEKECNEKIKAAEKQKNDLLLQATELANQEISKKREDLQSAFDAEKKDTSKEEAVMNAKIDVAKKQNLQDYNANKDAVILMIAERVVTVNLELQRNVIADFSRLRA